MTEITRREILRGSAMLGVAAGLPLAAEARKKKGDSAKKESTSEAPKKLKLLVAGAHPDDPESGCGGIIALYAQAGHEVVNLYLTRGEAGIPGKTHEEAAQIRTAEAEAACKILQARPVFATQVDGATEVTPHRYEEIAKLIAAENPDIVLTHWPLDTHRDHRAMSLLVYEAWLCAKKPFALFFFEVESGRQTKQFYPTHYVDISSVESKKREACYAHASQGPKMGFYDQDHMQMQLFRGREIDAKYAEAFMCHDSAALQSLAPPQK